MAVDGSAHRWKTGAGLRVVGAQHGCARSLHAAETVRWQASTGGASPLVSHTLSRNCGAHCRPPWEAALSTPQLYDHKEWRTVSTQENARPTWTTIDTSTPFYVAPNHRLRRSCLPSPHAEINPASQPRWCRSGKNPS
eukprot:CAMPEP_0204353606 /NCGR_PEP_ID=MMETSP0469-20131031/32802_1 /ASSEMBLY_ACC=CAM_ASM_000384 /TAXON_ID=2969 /ORGANISM="Oxyrrhis marina" /LENGTH=137 /DNA_ID=CAMNT_0051340567 /DNA_START=185 /DNA_END=594 /DNA_ORIENTATION=+